MRNSRSHQGSHETQTQEDLQEVFALLQKARVNCHRHPVAQLATENVFFGFSELGHPIVQKRCPKCSRILVVGLDHRTGYPRVLFVIG
jgi:hypothetical protein